MEFKTAMIKSAVNELQQINSTLKELNKTLSSLAEISQKEENCECKNKRTLNE